MSVKVMLDKQVKVRDGDVFDAPGYTQGWFMNNGVEAESLSSIKAAAFPNCDINAIRNYYVRDTLQLTKYSLKGATAENIKRAFDLKVSELYRTLVQEYRDKLSYNPEYKESARAEMAKWLKAITRREDEKDLAVMMHFIWQTVRKLHNKPVTHHIMNVLVGKQGGGKSMAVLRLLEPLGPLVAHGQGVDFVESSEKAYPLLSKHYVCFLDELARAQRTDINKLKSVITNPSLTYRGYHTQDYITVPNNCTFIANCNEDLPTLLPDNTGMRRFYTTRTIDGAALPYEERVATIYNVINNINYEMIWRGVDPNDDVPPIQPYLDEIIKDQEQLRSKDIIEHFLEDAGVVVDAAAETKGSELYDLYKAYVIKNGVRNTSPSPFFYRRIESLGITRKQTRPATFGCRIEAAAVTNSLDNINGLSLD